MKPPKIVRDLFTGPDGSTWALGRVYSLPMLVSGLAVPFAMLIHGQPVSLSELGLMFGGLGGGVMALVAGTNHTEPKADQPPV